MGRRRDESAGQQEALTRQQPEQVLPSAHLQETCAYCTVCWRSVDHDGFFNIYQDRKKRLITKARDETVSR